MLPVIGVIENMKRVDSTYIADAVKALHVPYLGSVSHDDGFESTLGNVDGLASTRFAADMRHIVQHTDVFDVHEER